MKFSEEITARPTKLFAEAVSEKEWEKIFCLLDWGNRILKRLNIL